MNLRFVTIMTALCLLTCSAVVRAQADGSTAYELAKIPYRAMYEMIHATKVGTQVTNSTYKVRIRSSLTNVTPADISLHIDSKSGPLPITLDAKGAILKFPETEELLQENPMIIANQPRGSIMSSQEMEDTRYSKHDGLMSYVQLMRPVHDAVAQLRWAESLSTNTAPEILALGMRLDEPDGKQIVIHSKAGDMVLQPDQKGVCAIPYTEQLYEEDPKISLPKTGIESVGFGVMDKGKR